MHRARSPPKGDTEDWNGAATIAARQRLVIGAKYIHNYKHGALIFSGNPAIIGEKLVNNNEVTGQSIALNNESATIDIQGDAHFNIGIFNNRDIHFKSREVQVGYSAGLRRTEPSPRIDRPNDYTAFDYSIKTTEKQIIHRDPAKVLIGGNLRLTGNSFKNDKSQVVMGGTMTGSLKTINNSEPEWSRKIEYSGTSQFTYTEWRGGFRQRTDRCWDTPVPYYDCKKTSIQLAVEQRNTRPTGSSLQIAERTELALQPTDHRQLAQFNPLPKISEVTALARHPSSGLAMVIRSSNAPLILPTSGLFTIDARASNRPLISTDPRFIKHHSGFSTQHLLQELRLNAPALPRLCGDSFHEQQRVRDQVIELTGHRFLPGYHSDARQQQALITQGIAAAQALQLTPGEPLTAAQQAQLTEAIVWPVIKPVTLVTGQKTEVLDPQLYIPTVAHAPISGLASIAAAEIRLTLTGDLHNSGTITAKTVNLTAENIHNQRGTVYGEVNHLTAHGDVHNQSGNLGAEKHLRIRAGQDFITQTATHTSKTSSSYAGYHESHCHTTLDQRAGLYVLQQQGVLEADAGRDITLGAVQVGEQQGRRNRKAGYAVTQGSSSDIGSQLKTAGDISFQAGRDFNATAAVVSSGIPVDNQDAPRLTQENQGDPAHSGRLRITAGNKITIREGQATENYHLATESTKKGFFSDKTTRTRDSQHQKLALESSFSGRQVTMIAGDQAAEGSKGQISVQGSSVVGDQQTTLVADNISITNAENYQLQSYGQQEYKSGLFFKDSSACQRQAIITPQSSAVGSLHGNLTIQASQHYRQIGSQVTAPQGMTEITADTVEILDAHKQLQLTQESSAISSSLTLSVGTPGFSAIQSAKQLQEAVNQTSDRRMQALAAAAGFLSVKNACDALEAAPQGAVNANAIFSVSKTHSKRTESHSVAHRSQMGGRTVIIKARKGDATIQGDVQAQEQLKISAAGQIKLLASETRSSQQSSQSSGSVSVGYGCSSGNGSSRGFPLLPGIIEVSGSTNSEPKESCSYRLARVSAGQKVVLESGGDTLVEGVVAAPQIQATINGNLTVNSRQSTDHQEGKEQRYGITLAGDAESESVSGSGNFKQDRYRSDLASVEEQAGFEAGDLGYQVTVKGNTHLGGAKIASTKKAVDEGRNYLGSGTVTEESIDNYADYDAQSIALGIGFSQSTQEPGQPALQEGGVGKDQQGQVTSGALQVPGSQLPSHHGFSATIPIVMNASGHACSTTRSGISGAGQAVTITNPAAQQALTGQTPKQAIASLDASVTSDQDGSNALAPIFNQQEIEAGFAIVGTLAREAGTFLENRTKEIKDKKAAAKELEMQAGDFNQLLSVAKRQALQDQANIGT